VRLMSTGALACALILAVAGAAGAAVPHTVQPGDTLWSIAAANGFTTRALAAYNGLGESSNVVLGRTVMVPTVGEAAGALRGQGGVASAAAPASAGVASSASTAAPAAMGAYVVRPGDTLSALAARSGVSAQRIAWMNGLSLNSPIVIGTSLKLPTGSPVAAPAAPQPVATAPQPAAPASPPYTTPARLGAAEIGSIASSTGVPASLAKAVAWQESGFNNGLVSSAGARGTMQIMPGTWDWVNRRLTSTPLNPSSATDNVRAGSLYLRQLLRMTGGNVPLAVAGYYQGLGSVRRQGMYSDTQRYVNDVLSLQRNFGG
jgi:soluble lytic murein transglycosylase-like protein